MKGASADEKIPFVRREPPMIYSPPTRHVYVALWDDGYISVDSRINEDQKDILHKASVTVSNIHGCETTQEVFELMGWERVF